MPDDGYKYKHISNTQINVYRYAKPLYTLMRHPVTGNWHALPFVKSST